MRDVLHRIRERATEYWPWFSRAHELEWKIANDGDPLRSIDVDPEPFLDWTLQENPIGSVGQCPTCGDPMDNGACKRCDWGGNMGWNTRDHPPDPTQELKPAITSSTSELMAHFASIRRYASKLEWIVDRPDKFKETPEGQNALGWLQHNVGAMPKIDALVPWLWREAKKGRLVFKNDHHPSYRNSSGEHRFLNPGPLAHMADWFADKNHPTRRGIDIMQHDISSTFDRVQQWDDEQQAKQKTLDQVKDEHTVHSWPDGWNLRKLPAEELEDEGDAMGHCIGGYQHDVRSGAAQMYSLRDPQGQPHVSMELRPKTVPKTPEAMVDDHLVARALPDALKPPLLAYLHGDHSQTWDQGTPVGGGGGHAGDLSEFARALTHADTSHKPHTGPEGARIVQIQGKGNETPKPEYQARLKDWFTKYPEADRPVWGESRSDINSIGQFGHEFGYDFTSDYDDPYANDDEAHGGYGPHGDYGVVTPPRKVDWDSVVDELSRTRGYGARGESRFETPEGDALYKVARERGEVPGLGDAVDKYAQKHSEDFDNLNPFIEDGAYDEDDFPALHPDMFDPEDWEARGYTQEDEDGHLSEPTPEHHEEAERKYYKARNEAERYARNEWPSLQAADHMHELLHPHMDGEAYTNEIAREPQKYNDWKDEMEPNTYHPAYKEWQAQQVAPGGQPMPPDVPVEAVADDQVVEHPERRGVYQRSLALWTL